MPWCERSQRAMVCGPALTWTPQERARLLLTQVPTHPVFNVGVERIGAALAHFQTLPPV